MGIKGKDFVMLCTSATAVQQIITMKDDEDKIVPLDTHTVLVGEASELSLLSLKKLERRETETQSKETRLRVLDLREWPYTDLLSFFLFCLNVVRANSRLVLESLVIVFSFQSSWQPT